MNRFEFCPAKLFEGESFVTKDKNIKLYDGNDKTNYEDGEILLTSHRLFWGRPGDIARGAISLCLPLNLIISLDEETASAFVFGKKKRIIINLKEPPTNKLPGPMDISTSNYIKISGRNGIDPNFVLAFNETLLAKIWEVTQLTSGGGGTPSDNEKSPRIKLRSGIVGIERIIHEKQQKTDENIQLAFKDLDKLMKMAKDMVTISKVISSKIRERQGEISEDETIRFKSYLMSLGIDDPVTRDNYENNTEYFIKLSKQLCEMLLDPITDVGGMMSLSDVYCRVNRARGLELLSPEDLLTACKLLNGPIKMRQFPSGSIILQLDSHNDEIVAEETAEQVTNAESLSGEELARMIGISIILSTERLLTAEQYGKICRDESIEGLRFYPNRFLI